MIIMGSSTMTIMGSSTTLMSTMGTTMKDRIITMASTMIMASLIMTMESITTMAREVAISMDTKSTRRRATNSNNPSRAWELKDKRRSIE